MRYFNISEFECKCGCGRNDMDDTFLYMIDYARHLAGIPFTVNSGFRCEKHNREEGSTSNNHTLGFAADIRCLSGMTRYKIITALLNVGFTRIGVHKTFIHCDNNPLGVKEVIWPY